ncbi:hypothetical protein GPOL_c44070 [Gordonia polyisoprenivorans VH2]|uniref:Uncharacterized protein n=1 Tax=Gordonia polyisoprenivorans (strain DSM 44266 / VH2) TaxID=1112204 RepID=H6MWJ9_GORPV|nr:hypothetical protein [Gordonia polyisoprenivorans]AFA75410.1 hypothetical protein GPOL_c44070 [Gordonia polyisoprenivorans VH2]
MTSLPTDEHGIVYRHACIAAGFTDDELRKARRSGAIVPLVRGAFVSTADRSRAEMHRLAVIATHQLGRFGTAVPSHQSAATLHRLPMLKPNLQRLHTTTGKAVNGSRTSTRHDHVGTIPDEQMTTVDGIDVPTIERTAVDVACTSSMGFAGAFAIFNSALRAGADRSTMVEILRTQRRGVAVARRALHHANGEAENPGEAWSDAVMIEAGLPTPRQQHEFFDDDRRFVARTDFDWAGKLVGEFDGRVKYMKYLRPGEQPADAVIREKKREDTLRRMGVMVVRWVWDDLEQGRVAAMLTEWLVTLALMAPRHSA